jgi:hypothetical protein
VIGELSATFEWREACALEAESIAFLLRAVTLAGAVALIGCARKPKAPTCVPSCSDTTSCMDSCRGRSCPCPAGDVCDSSGACVPCVAGSCKFSSTACVDECGNADTACATTCAQPDTCVDNCGIAETAACAGAECDPQHPGGCRDTCGQYAAKCCCVPTSCTNAMTCVDDCGNFDPSECRGQMCGISCYDTCGELDGSCWVACSDPTNCQDNCGNFNSDACAGILCDLKKAGFDTCGNVDEGC